MAHRHLAEREQQVSLPFDRQGFPNLARRVFGHRAIQASAPRRTTLENQAAGASRVASTYQRCLVWDIEGMFQRLESVLHSEIRSLGHPRAALLGFAVAVLAYNVLNLLQRCVEKAYQEQKPPLKVSSYHLALHIRSGYEGMLIALPPEQWRSYDGDPTALARRLLQLARNIDPRQVATSKRGPKIAAPKEYVDGAVARAHVSTARVLAQARTRP